MSDRNWDQLPEELKALGQKPPETPTNPVEFKERVLQEYERRTRFHSRSRWMRRAMTTVAACAAVLIGVLVATPANRDALLHSFQSNQTQTTADDRAYAGLNQQEVVEKYFDLQLQKRPTEAQALLAKQLQGKTPVFGVNRTVPHLTSYRLLPIKTDDNTLHVTLTWATYDTEAKTQDLEVSLAQERGHWVIDNIQELQAYTYLSPNQTTLDKNLTMTGRMTERIYSKNLPPLGKWGFFAVDPADPEHIAMAREDSQPQVYLFDGMQARLLTTLPAGEIGEILWGEGGMLVVNFSPQHNLSAQEIWFVDAKTGAAHQEEWLVKQQKALSQPHITAVQMLPGNRLRLRAGVRSYIADLDQKSLTQEQLRPPQIDEVVYEAANQTDLPSKELSFLSPADAQNWLRNSGIPSDKQIDPAREVGYYLFNGSVESITLEGSDLQVEVCADPGRLQVLRIPYTRLLGMVGKSVTFHVFDESGMSLVPSQTVQVP